MSAAPPVTTQDSGAERHHTIAVVPQPPSASKGREKKPGFVVSAMFFKELVAQGWLALMRDRTRSALTMLGIGWGLVSVVLLLAYGQGLGGCVLSAFLNMGNNVIVLWPGQTSMQAR